MSFRIDEIAGEEVSISENDELVLTFNYGKSASHPFIHPIYTPDGHIVTEGILETKQIHLPGLCFTLGNVKDENGSILSLQRKITNCVVEIIEPLESEKILNIVSETTWKVSDLVLIETYQIKILPIKNNVRILEIKVELQMPSKSIEFKNGIGLGYNAVEMEHLKSANADGYIGEAEVNSKASEWVTLCGIVANTAVGVAICPHTTNGHTQFLAEDVNQGFLFAKNAPITLNANENQGFSYCVLIYHGDLFTFDVGEYYSKFCK